MRTTIMFSLLVCCVLTMLGCGGSSEVVSDLNATPAIDLGGLPATTVETSVRFQPVISAGPGQTMARAEWSLLQPSAATGVLQSSVNRLTGVATVQFPRNGRYRFRLEVENGSGLVATHVHVIDVIHPEPFSFVAQVTDDGAPATGLVGELEWQPFGGVSVMKSAVAESGIMRFDGLIGSLADFEVLVPGTR